MKTLMKYACLATALFSLTTMTHGQNIDVISPDSDSLKWTDLKTLSGAKMAVLVGNPEKKGYFVVRVKFPADFTVAPHHHVIDEYETIVSGTYYLGTGNKFDKDNGTPLAAGSFIKVPAKINHYGWTKEETVIQVSGIGPWGAVYEKSEKKHA